MSFPACRTTSPALAANRHVFRDVQHKLQYACQYLFLPFLSIKPTHRIEYYIPLIDLEIVSMEDSNSVDMLTTNAATNGSRWNPTKEQINLLESLYNQGIRTPTAEQIQQITGMLRAFGHIEGKNVFYWFQNHKARQRQKQKQENLAFFNHFHYPYPHPHHLYLQHCPNGTVHSSSSSSSSSFSIWVVV